MLRGFLHQPGTQVLAVCDTDAQKLEHAREAAEKHYAEERDLPNYRGCDAYLDYCEILDRPDIDAVVIATPDHWHAVQVIHAAAAGKDIYCEKPLSLTLAEARDMVRAVRRYGCVFQTGSMQRSDRKFRQACELVRNGYLGEIKSVAVSIETGFANHPLLCDLPAQTVPEELKWEMWLGPAPLRPYHEILAPPIEFTGWPAWRNYRDYSGGGMTDWGAHHFDIAQWGLGMDESGPVEIIPPGRGAALLTYRYASGTTMTADFEGNGIVFTGTRGELEVNRRVLQTRPERLASHPIGANEIRLYESNDHKLDWLECVRERRRPICDVETGCRSVSVCHLGNIAVELDRPLKWDPDKERFRNDPEANRLCERAKRSPWRI